MWRFSAAGLISYIILKKKIQKISGVGRFVEKRKSKCMREGNDINGLPPWEGEKENSPSTNIKRLKQEHVTRVGKLSSAKIICACAESSCHVYT